MDKFLSVFYWLVKGNTIPKNSEKSVPALTALKKGENMVGLSNYRRICLLNYFEAIIFVRCEDFGLIAIPDDCR